MKWMLRVPALAGLSASEETEAARGPADSPALRFPGEE